jgi:hypothetical protein
MFGTDIDETIGYKKGKGIPVRGCAGPHCCEASRLPHFLDNWLTDGGDFIPRKIPGTHFCQRLSRPQGNSTAGRFRSIEKSNDLIGNQTRTLLACTIVPQGIENITQ